jgi:hypothetical protein
MHTCLGEGAITQGSYEHAPSTNACCLAPTIAIDIIVFSNTARGEMTRQANNCGEVTGNMHAYLGERGHTGIAQQWLNTQRKEARMHSCWFSQSPA